MIFSKKKEIVREKKEPKPEPDPIKNQEKLWPEYDKEISEKIDINLFRAALRKMGIYEYIQERVIKAYGRLVLELADKLPRYNTIVSDDASGRIPSLVFYEIIKKEREKKGKSAPAIYFIAGGTFLAPAKKDSIFNFLDSKKMIVGKTLLITEFVQSGESIKFLMRTLEDVGIDFDAISISADSEKKRSWPKELKRKLLFGIWGEEGATAHYQKSEKSGVFKDRFNPSPHPQRLKAVSNEVLEAREGIKVLAGELSKLLEVKI